LFQYGLGLVQYFVVPEAHDPIPHSFKLSASFRVVAFLFGMLTAVGLDNQFGLETQEIDDIRLDSHLTPELVSVQPPPSQLPPQQLFGIGGMPAQCAGTCIE